MFGFIHKLRSALLPPGLVLLGIILIVGGIDEANTSKAMADHGKTATAQVDSVKWKEKGLTKREKDFKAEITFETEDKQTITASVNVPASLGKDIRDDKAEAVLVVKYLPEDPHKIILADHTDDSAAMFAGAALSILVGIGIFFYRRRKAVAAIA